MAVIANNSSAPGEPINYAFYKRLMIGLGVLVPTLVAILYTFPGTFRIPGLDDLRLALVER